MEAQKKKRICTQLYYLGEERFLDEEIQKKIGLHAVAYYDKGRDRYEKIALFVNPELAKEYVHGFNTGRSTISVENREREEVVELVPNNEKTKCEECELQDLKIHPPEE